MATSNQSTGVALILVAAAVLYAYNRAHSTASSSAAPGTGPLPPALPPSAMGPGWHPPMSLNPSAYLYGQQASSPYSQAEYNSAFASPGHAPVPGGISGLGGVNLAQLGSRFAPPGIGTAMSGADAGLIAARNSSVGLIREPAKFICSALAIFGVCKSGGGGSAPAVPKPQPQQAPYISGPGGITLNPGDNSLPYPVDPGYGMTPADF